MKSIRNKLDPESSNIFISFVDLQLCIFMGNMLIVIGESIFRSIVSIIGVLFSTYTLASDVKVSINIDVTTVSCVC